MNVFNKVTLESLKKNRTRTVVTIIGIMLSAAMICASTTFVSSMQNFVLRCEIYSSGDWHGAVYDAAYKDYEDIRDSGKVSSAAYAQVLGYANIGSANEYKPYLYVLGGDAASGYFETIAAAGRRKRTTRAHDDRLPGKKTMEQTDGITGSSPPRLREIPGGAAFRCLWANMWSKGCGAERNA